MEEPEEEKKKGGEGRRETKVEQGRKESGREGRRQKDYPANKDPGPSIHFPI